MSFPKYEDIVIEMSGGIGTIKVYFLQFLSMYDRMLNPLQFNRPKSLNAMGGHMVPETIDALRILNDHPNTTFTVLTGEGRFFSAGADVKGILPGLLVLSSFLNPDDYFLFSAVRD